MGGDVFVPSALIASAGNNANEYLAKHVAELGYLRPTIVASGGEARRRMGDIDFEVVIINTKNSFVVGLYGPLREKAESERPQSFQFCKNKNKFSAEYGQSLRRPF